MAPPDGNRPGAITSAAAVALRGLEKFAAEMEEDATAVSHLTRPDDEGQRRDPRGRTIRARSHV
jgi:hypothetical protein